MYGGGLIFLGRTFDQYLTTHSWRRVRGGGLVFEGVSRRGPFGGRASPRAVRPVHRRPRLVCFRSKIDEFVPESLLVNFRIFIFSGSSASALTPENGPFSLES